MKNQDVIDQLNKWIQQFNISTEIATNVAKDQVNQTEESILEKVQAILNHIQETIHNITVSSTSSMSTFVDNNVVIESNQTQPPDFIQQHMLFFMSCLLFIVMFTLMNKSTKRYNSLLDSFLYRVVIPIISSIVLIPMMLVRFVYGLFCIITCQKHILTMFEDINYTIEGDAEGNVHIFMGTRWYDKKEYQPIIESTCRDVDEHIEHGHCSHHPH